MAVTVSRLQNPSLPAKSLSTSPIFLVCLLSSVRWLCSNLWSLPASIKFSFTGRSSCRFYLCSWHWVFLEVPGGERGNLGCCELPAGSGSVCGSVCVGLCVGLCVGHSWATLCCCDILENPLAQPCCWHWAALCIYLCHQNCPSSKPVCATWY